MDSVLAFAMGAMHRNDRKKVFDWDKAASIIHKKKPTLAMAGLGEDWECTGGTIYEDGKPDTSDYTYLASTWAIPELWLEYEEGNDEVIPCWKYEDETDWNEKTKWPESSLKILQ